MAEFNQENITTATEMPFQMRIIVSGVFFLLSLWFSLLIIDVVSSEANISINKKEISAEIIHKKSTHGKDGYKYYIEYTFSYNERAYSRRFLFRLCSKKTQVSRAEYESYEIGNSVSVLFAKHNPGYNRLKNEANMYHNFIFYLLGIAVFGAISINEAKNIAKGKR